MRELNQIWEENIFLFPTKSSRNHALGWNDLSDTCKKVGLDTSNRTRNRHQPLNSMNLSKNNKQLVYEMIGDSENVNVNIYQAPQAEQHLSVTGRILTEVDKGLEHRAENRDYQENPAVQIPQTPESPPRKTGKLHLI